jgi:uncharacterized membrane protein YcaP (DUF421 family)
MQTSLLELLIRGTAIYLGMFFLLRVILKRESGSLTIAELLVAILLGNAAQNSMVGDSTSITDSFILFIVIIGWNYIINLLGYTFPAFRKISNPPPLLLVKDGKMIAKNMHKELILKEELESALRENGLDDLSQVKEAFMEGDGKISIVPYEKAQGSTGSDRRGPMGG